MDRIFFSFGEKDIFIVFLIRLVFGSSYRRLILKLFNLDCTIFTLFLCQRYAFLLYQLTIDVDVQLFYRDSLYNAIRVVFSIVHQKEILSNVLVPYAFSSTYK